MQKFDIAIIGGGLSGACLARALSPLGFSMALIELNPPRLEQKNPHARALALSRQSISFFNTIGIFDSIAREAQPIQQVHVSVKERFGVTKISPELNDPDPLGYVVNADQLTEVLWQNLEALSGLTIYSPSSLEYLSRQGIHSTPNFETFTEWKLHLSQGEFLEAKLLIAADGMHSSAREIIGIESTPYDFKTSAILSNVTLSSDVSHSGIAYERFLSGGSIAFLPLTNSQMKCVLILPETEAFQKMEISDNDYLAEIQKAFGSRLGQFQLCSPRTRIPLKGMVAHHLYALRCLLIGNAANTVHPIAAQGFNLACRDIAQLARHLNQAKSQGIDIGAISSLRHYAESRAPDHARIRTFTQTMLLDPILLQMGILASEFINPLRRHITQLGMGENIIYT